MLTKIKVAVAIAAMACCTNLNAQDCGYGGPAMGFGGGYGYAPVQTGGGCGCGGEMNNCGREISQGDAAALWGNYCSERCQTVGGHHGLFSRLKGGCGGGGASGFGGGGCGCGCDQGCFGYPAGGCGCNAAGGCGGGYGGGLLAGKLGGGCGKCGSKGRCGCRSKRSKRGASACGEAPVGFSGGCDTCGCSDGGSYFNQPVGYDYGTAGIHSAVQGCATGACGQYGAVGAPTNYGAPMMQHGQPAQGPEVVGEAVPSANAADEPGQIPGFPSTDGN